MDLPQWLTTLARELGVDDVRMDDEVIRTLLDLTRDCAHEVEKVAAPLSSYLIGVAVGRGADVHDASRQATGLLLSEDPPAAG